MAGKNKCLICLDEIFEFNFSLKNSVSSDSKFFNKSIVHMYCNNCGYIFIKPEKRLDISSFYEMDYDFLLDGEIEPSLNEKKYSENLVDFFAPFIIRNSEKSFFDIGAGKGNLLEAFFSRFTNLKYTALEPSKAYHLLKNKKFINESYNSFFNSSNFKYKFDFLSLIGVLEHVPDPKLFLLDIRKIMHQETLLLIEVPNFLNDKADLMTIDHISKFTNQSLENIFNITGFEIVKKQILSDSVPMKYIVKISENKNLNKINIKPTLNEAKKYLNNILSDAKKIQNEKIAIYGQGLIAVYLLGSKIFDAEKISCLIEDNPLYWGKLFKNNIPIVDFNTFKIKYNNKKIFLAMNDCYHNNVTIKLNEHDVYGSLL